MISASEIPLNIIVSSVMLLAVLKAMRKRQKKKRPLPDQAAFDVELPSPDRATTEIVACIQDQSDDHSELEDVVADLFFVSLEARAQLMVVMSMVELAFTLSDLEHVIVEEVILMLSFA